MLSFVAPTTAATIKTITSTDTKGETSFTLFNFSPATEFKTNPTTIGRSTIMTIETTIGTAFTSKTADA